MTKTKICDLPLPIEYKKAIHMCGVNKNFMDTDSLMDIYKISIYAEQSIDHLRKNVVPLWVAHGWLIKEKNVNGKIYYKLNTEVLEM